MNWGKQAIHTKHSSLAFTLAQPNSRQSCQRKFTVGYLTSRLSASESCHTKAAFVCQLLGCFRTKRFHVEWKGHLLQPFLQCQWVRELRTFGEVHTQMVHGLLSTRTVLREDLVNETKKMIWILLSHSVHRKGLSCPYIWTLLIGVHVLIGQVFPKASI